MWRWQLLVDCGGCAVVNCILCRCSTLDNLPEAFQHPSTQTILSSKSSLAERIPRHEYRSRIRLQKSTMAQSALEEDFPFETDVPLIPTLDLNLAPQRNVADETRRNLMFQEVLKSRVTGRTEHVEYGTYYGKPACLMVLRFWFTGPRKHFRWTFGEITIAFSKLESTTGASPAGPHPAGPTAAQAASPTADPAIVVFSPTRTFGDATAESRNWTFELTMSVKSSVGPVEAGPEGKIGFDSSYNRDHRMAIIGSPSRPTRSGGFEEVGWTLEENDKQESGIPFELPVAMIVEYQGPFQAEVRVDVTNNFGIPVFARPWRKDDDPLLFNLKDPGFKKKTSGAFEAMTEEKWKDLLRLKAEFEVSRQ
jgi:hypothetical protein